MVLGRPVVASDVAGSRDLVVHGKTGRLVPEGDTAAFADAVVDVLRDPAEATALGSAGRTRSALFSRDRMARGTLDVYRQVTGASMGVPSEPPRQPHMVTPLSRLQQVLN
jgi:glycosyltransferase involved in cell wall biosynthesis